ncbi:hypothetical protein Tco_1477115 [Tanacetum coccineum]
MSGTIPPIPPPIGTNIEDFSSWKDKFLVYLDGLEPYHLEVLENRPFVPMSPLSTSTNPLTKPLNHWSPKDRKLANHDKRLKNKTLNYPYYTDDAKIDAYYDLPPLLPCFKPIQPYTQRKNESYKAELDEEINYISDEESVMSDQGIIDNTDAPDAPNLDPHDEGISSDDEVDEWFVTEMEEYTKKEEIRKTH